MKLVDLTGQKFGKLTVVEIAYRKNKRIFWKCLCDCGNYSYVDGGNLKSGHTSSCGCLQKELGLAPSHHLRFHRLYNIWSLMKKRCINSTDKLFSYYGGRGIKICDEWKNDFKVFYDWAMASGYQENLTIDRIDVNGNYEPNNCRWITQKEQVRNIRSNHLITYNNETHCIAEWAELYSLPYRTFWKRLKKGWNFEKALLTPVKIQYRHKESN